MNKPISHDALLSKCFIWLWNTYPQTRYCCFHVKNENRPEPVKQIVSSAIKFFGMSVSPDRLDVFAKSWVKNHIIKMSQDKAIGIVPGVLDLIFYWSGTLHAFDVKIGQDRLSQHQQAFIQAMVKQGGEAHVISSLEQFQAIIKKIVT